ncbi:hypothetical protein S7335_2424 [Synechococcus sp. PCC 7335]|nr:hypothetical protein S7335_2424 [Synechococcus sp. PCC 7335]
MTMNSSFHELLGVSLLTEVALQSLPAISVCRDIVERNSIVKDSADVCSL